MTFIIPKNIVSLTIFWGLIFFAIINHWFIHNSILQFSFMICAYLYASALLGTMLFTFGISIFTYMSFGTPEEKTEFLSALGNALKKHTQGGHFIMASVCGICFSLAGFYIPAFFVIFYTLIWSSIYLALPINKAP